MVLVLGLAIVVLLCVIGVLVFRRPPTVIPVGSPSARQTVSVVKASPEQLVREGRKIEAIKRYRELSGVGLREAKAAVDEMEGGRSISLPPKGSLLLRQVNDSEIEAQIRTGHLIDAIRLYREKTGVGLKEAKVAVEAWRDRMRAS